MILEVANLYVKDNEQDEFERDFVIASEFISSIDGYIKHSLSKCIEVQNKYILLVEWENLESHTEGFRDSTQYLEWKKLLHHYYEPFPIVEHFEPIYFNQK